MPSIAFTAASPPLSPHRRACFPAASPRPRPLPHHVVRPRVVRLSATASSASPSPSPSPSPSSSSPVSPSVTSSSPISQPLLVRAALGHPVPRPPVWLMRQAGRYMAAFRAYSDVQPFRQRSETSSTAIQLSLQPYQAFGVDAIIMFSDILTPLPAALHMQFEMRPGIGPTFPTPLRSDLSIHTLLTQCPIDSFLPTSSLPFVADTLDKLRHTHLQHDPHTALLGFVGAPFTLAAYMIEGRGSKVLSQVKRFMYADDSTSTTSDNETATPHGLHALLSHLADVIARYAIFQLDSGAHAVQLFESWAHHLSPVQFETYALPYAARIVQAVKAARPHAPVLYFANGSAGKLRLLKKALAEDADVIALDWGVGLDEARNEFGHDVVLQGNVDPAILAVGSEAAIRQAVHDTVRVGGEKLILNLGHGVMKETPEDAVRAFVDEVKKLA